MSATATKPKTTAHSDEIRALLKRGSYSEGTELSEAQVTALEELKPDAKVSAIEAIVTGKSKAKAPRSTYSDDVRTAFTRALDITGTPDKGGPKYPLTIKQADAVKKALGSKAKGVKDANDGIAAVSDAQLRKIAKGTEASKEATSAVRAFLKAHTALREDRTMYARKGAAIVLAFREGA